MAHYRDIEVDGKVYQWVVGRSDRLTIKGLGTFDWETLGHCGTYWSEMNDFKRPKITPKTVEMKIREETKQLA